LAGCGPTNPHIAPVNGTVTLDGQPVNEARLIFQPEAVGSPSYGFTDQNGRYELGYKRGVSGALIGWHKVSIKMDVEVVGQAGKIVVRRQAIPERYNDNSELRREVEPGKANVFNFELTSDRQ
jgi:hypothetical protein